MIPTATHITEVDNLPGEEVPFRIGNPIWVMKNLAKLYSDTTTAVIREYSTNAMDSHIMAGKPDEPIHVTLPNMMDPYFVVQDFGLGMSKEDLREIYTSFGDSMKRQSADTNGILGFGSKSAVAYTNQFTVVAVKDGIETHAIVSKRPDFSMTLKIVVERETDAENGVKITVPVNNREEFRTKAKNFYRFWRPGTVLVDGEQPEQAVGEKIEDNLYFSASPGVSYVVMGNVGYRIANPDALFRNSRMNAISFVAYVEGGAVEHTPSREDLEYTDHTKATLQRIVDNFETRMLDTAKAQIVGAATSQEAWRLWNMWCGKLGTSMFSGMEYKGKKLVNHINTPDAIRYRPPTGSYGSRYNTGRYSHVEVESASRALFITNFNHALNTDHKKKARTYFEQVLHKSINYVYFLKGDVDKTWIPVENVVDWDVLKASLPKTPKKPRVAGPARPKGLFDYYSMKGGKCIDKTYAKEIPANADVFYVTAGDANKYDVSSALTAAKADDDVVVVILAVNRIEKFKRDNFGARDFIQWAKNKIVMDTETLLDARTKLAMGLGTFTIHWLDRLDATKIDDPDWADCKDLLTHRNHSEEYRRNLELASSLGMRYSVKEYHRSGEDNSLTDKYPLLAAVRYGTLTDALKTHLIMYINAAYAAKKGKP